MKYLITIGLVATMVVLLFVYQLVSWMSNPFPQYEYLIVSLPHLVVTLDEPALEEDLIRFANHILSTFPELASFEIVSADDQIQFMRDSGELTDLSDNELRELMDLGTEVRFLPKDGSSTLRINNSVDPEVMEIANNYDLRVINIDSGGFVKHSGLPFSFIEKLNITASQIIY